MAFLSMRHDFRAPAFAPESSKEIYATALEQFAWADEHGFDSLVLSEHHGVDDGWMPAPLTMAAAVLARTARARLMISAAILPLHDPIRVAEQIAVLDNAFPGRMWVVFGAGYRVEEFEMARLERVADDPDRAWAEIGKYVLYEAQTYASFQTPGQHSTPSVQASSVDDLKASPQYVVGTPDAVLARLREVPAQGGIVFNPLAGGLPSALAWSSLELFAAKVLPRLRALPGDAP